jgi:hypothetical protein
MRTTSTALKAVLLSLLATAMVQAQDANPPKLTALVIETAGHAAFFKPGSKDPQTIQVNKTRLEAGDRVVTRPNSRVVLLIEGKPGTAGGGEPKQTTVEIKPQSRVQISELFADLATGAENARVSVDYGQITANVRKIDPASERFEVQTLTAVAAVRGTRFSTKVLPAVQGNPKVSFRVYRGKIAILDPRTRKSRRLLDDGDTLDIEPNGAYIQGSMGGTSQTGNAGGALGGPPGGTGQFSPGDRGEDDEDRDTGTFPERSEGEEDDTGSGRGGGQGGDSPGGKD